MISALLHSVRLYNWHSFLPLSRSQPSVPLNHLCSLGLCLFLSFWQTAGLTLCLHTSPWSRDSLPLNIQWSGKVREVIKMILYMPDDVSIVQFPAPKTETQSLCWNPFKNAILQQISPIWKTKTLCSIYMMFSELKPTNHSLIMKYLTYDLCINRKYSRPSLKHMTNLFKNRA